MEKRKYQNRRKEFLDMTAEQLVEYKDTVLSPKIGEIQAKITKNEATDEDKLEYKELFHKRQRLYRRLSKLGKPIRGEQENPKSTNVPVAPETPVVVEPALTVIPNAILHEAPSADSPRVTVTSTKYSENELNSTTESSAKGV